MEASTWLLEARSIEAGNQEGQRRVRGERSRLRGGRPPDILLRPTGNPLLRYLVAERWLASIGWLAAGGPLKGCWCYVCKVTANNPIKQPMN